LVHGEVPVKTLANKQTSKDKQNFLTRKKT